MPDKREIINSIADLAKKLGRAPTRAEFTARSGISAFFVLHWFRSWSEAVEAAGFRPYTVNKRVEDRALLEDWGRTTRRSRAILPRHIYRREGKYNPCTFAKRFRGWTGVPEAFRNFAKGKREWGDVLALLPTPKSKRENGKAKEKGIAVISANPMKHAVMKDRPIYGNPMSFGGLRHEPVDEQGVVLLFGMLAKDLGYVVENVHKGFPDCEAKRQVGTDGWQRVNIEFEYESKNFHVHGHSVDGCDVIVCWRHNWPACPKHIEILELSTIVESPGNAAD